LGPELSNGHDRRDLAGEAAGELTCDEATPPSLGSGARYEFDRLTDQAGAIAGAVLKTGEPARASGPARRVSRLRAIERPCSSTKAAPQAGQYPSSGPKRSR
jgi:hypothetical protein